MATWRRLTAEDIGVWLGYDDRHLAKAIPTARWDRSLKCWRVNAYFLNEVLDVVERLNGDRCVEVELVDAISELFVALPQSLHKPVHRALAHILHPDHGGDANAMRALNMAIDRVS